jgi:hypothetical protein
LFLIFIIVGFLNLISMGSAMSDQEKKKFCMDKSDYELCMERLND